MLKITAIKQIHNYTITLLFNNGVIKDINLLDEIQKLSSSYVNKTELLKQDVFCNVKIGSFGQLYWENLAYMKDEKNQLENK